MSPTRFSMRPQRRILSIALLSALAAPAFAGGNCQLVDDANNPLPIDSSSTGAESLACGPDAKAIADGAVAVGDETAASGKNATAVGSWIDLDGDGLIDSNEITWAKGDGATALGAASQALGANTVAVGVRSVATPDNSVAIGNRAQTQAQRTTTTTTTVQGTPNTVTTTTTDPTPAPGNQAGSIAMGDQARTNGANNIAIGTGATTEMVISGTTATTTDGITTKVQTALAGPVQNATAIGNGARANGNGTVVIGGNARAEAKVATLIVGWGDRTAVYDPGPATNSTVIGYSAASQGTNNVVIGAGAQTMGDTALLQRDPITGAPIKDPDGYSLYEPIIKDRNSTVVGAGAAAVRGWGTAFGYTAIAYGYQSSAIGSYSYAVGPGSTSMGGYLDYGRAFGAEARPTPGSGPYGRAVSLGYGSQSFGGGAYTWGNFDTAVGPAAGTSDRDSTSDFSTDALDPTMINGSIAMGFVAKAEGHSSIAIGLQSRTHDLNGIAIGNQSVAWGVESLALGNHAIASWHQDIALGNGSMALGGFGTGNTALGWNAKVDNLAGGDTSNAMAFGTDAEAMADDATAVGHMASATGSGAMAMGNATQASGTSAAALGDGAQATGAYSAAVGSYAYAGNDNTFAAGNSAFALGVGSTAVGYNSFAAGDDSVAVGSYAIADATLASAFGSGAMATADNSVAIGAGSVADRANTVSVGAAGHERQISNVAAGTEGTDAVNVDQLTNAIAQVDGAIGNLGDTAVQYDDAATRDKVTLGGITGTTIGNLRAGTAQTDAVNVAQLGSVLAGFGGGAAFDGSGMMTTPTFSLLGTQYNTVADAFAAIGSGIAGLGDRLTIVEEHMGGAHSDIPVGTGDGLPIGESSAAVSGSDTAVGNGATVDADGSTAVGSNASVSTAATNAVAVGADASVTAASGTAVGQGASVSAENSVAIGQGSVANEANTVSVGSADNARRVVNVAAGTNATDAANVEQVQAGDAQTLSRANAYTDSRYQAMSDEFTDLKNDIGYRVGKQDERIDRQGAMSAAMLNMSMNAANSRSPRGRIGVGAGWQNGESALSVGYSKAIGDRASFSIGGAFSSDDSSAGVGVGIDL